MEIFNFIKYNVGDVVIRKNKGVTINNSKPGRESIVEVKEIESDNYTYQVLFFASNPLSPHVAWEYEPFDKEEKEQYYKALKEIEREIKPNKIRKRGKTKTQDSKFRMDKEFKDKLNSKL